MDPQAVRPDQPRVCFPCREGLQRADRGTIEKASGDVAHLSPASEVLHLLLRHAEKLGGSAHRHRPLDRHGHTDSMSFHRLSVYRLAVAVAPHVGGPQVAVRTPREGAHEQADDEYPRHVARSRQT